MNNAVQACAGHALKVARTVARHRRLALAAFAIAAMAGALAISRVPDRYEASAVVYVDTQTVLKPLMTGLAHQPDVDQQLGMLARTLISKPNVERLLQTPGLEIDVSSRDAREAAVGRLRKQIKIESAGSTNLYEISYRGASPGHAQRVVEATVDLFVHAGTRTQAREAQDAGRFIDEQVRAYEAKLIEAENRLKEFKLRNFGVAGQPGTTNEDLYKRMSALTDGVSRLRVELAGAERTRDAFQRELASEEPRALAELPLTPNAAGAVPLDARGRLALQKRQLAEMRMRYTEAHPDVVFARQVIKQLEAEAAAEARASPGRRARGVPSASNPVYAQLRISLAEAEAKVESLRSQLVAQQQQLEEVRSVASRVPQVDAEFAQLNRDYEVIRKNYELMVGRRESASLGAKLNQSAQLTEFRLIEPPSVSQTPVLPSRLHLSLAAMLAALAAGIGAPLAIERLRPGFEEPEALARFGERPVVGAVPALVTEQGLRAQRASALGFAAAFGVLFIAQVLWVAWIASASALR